MVDTSAEADIRGIDLDNLAYGYADEMFVLKNLCSVSSTSAREIRWQKKTAGILAGGNVTTALTGSLISNVAFKARPFVVEDSWTRVTSYVRKYFVESPWISQEDIQDSQVDIWGDNMRQLVRAVSNQVEKRILSVLGDTLGTGGSVNTAAATADGWNDVETGDPIADINTGIENIRNYSYDISNLIIYMNPAEEKHIKNYLISVKGSSFPSFAADLLTKTRLMELLGGRVIVSPNMSTDTVIMFVANLACKWKEFTPLTTAVIEDKGIGKKIRVWEEGEALLVHPRAVHVITDTIV